MEKQGLRVKLDYSNYPKGFVGFLEWAEWLVPQLVAGGMPVALGVRGPQLLCGKLLREDDPEDWERTEYFWFPLEN